MSDVVLAIVGSTQFAKDQSLRPVAVELVLAALQVFRPRLVVSGGAEGIDQLAVMVADANGFDTEEFPAKVRKWDGPGGFKERNMVVASTCTHLLAIRHHASTTFGSGWTALEAQRLGREVGRIRVLPRVTQKSETRA